MNIEEDKDGFEEVNDNARPCPLLTRLGGGGTVGVTATARGLILTVRLMVADSPLSQVLPTRPPTHGALPPINFQGTGEDE